MFYILLESLLDSSFGTVGQGLLILLARTALPQLGGRGRIFPIASFLVAKIHPVFVAPRFSHSKISAPLAVVLIVLTGPS